MTDVGVGMLGYAFMGKAHVNAFKKLPYIVYPPPAVPRLVAIAGRDEEAVREAAQRYGFATYYTDWRRLIADPAVQLLDNGGSNDVHAAPCIAALEAGKHVLCEKPMARDATEAKQMLDAARRAGVKHMVAFNYRFVPAVRLAHDLVRAGHLGEIRHFRAAYLQDWITDPEFPRTWRLDRKAAGSGALGDLGSHIIDLARFIVGEPRAVAAMTKTFIAERPLPAGGGRAAVDVDDAFAAVIELDGGCIGTLEATRFALGRKNHQVLEVNGSKGSLSFDLERLNELNVYWHDADASGTRGWTEVLVTEPTHPFISNWWPPGHVIGWEHTFVHEIAHLLDAIVNDREVAPLGATFEDGYRNAVICDAIQESALEGRRVDIA
ncbi:MAG: Gfo/Idh/MocA family oxidoreductase [Chloroflexi bacterium]|nr:MAG: Gfo/Idh/MocA family oxidoreductase [Chloroflexota bacterium]TMC71202.1 MAG: Gfo/Idh/MocA family oxidoreductase [Chloroflexota bacterium]